MIISIRKPGTGRSVERARSIPYGWSYDATQGEKTIKASITGPNGINYTIRLNEQDIAAIEKAYEMYKEHF